MIKIEVFWKLGYSFVIYIIFFLYYYLVVFVEGSLGVCIGEGMLDGKDFWRVNLEIEKEEL